MVDYNVDQSGCDIDHNFSLFNTPNYDPYINTHINNSEELNCILKEKSYKKYVDFRCSIDAAVNKYKFLNKFKMNEHDGYFVFDSKKVNDYFGYDMLQFKSLISSYVINKIINEYYRKQKRIIENFLGICEHD